MAKNSTKTKSGKARKDKFYHLAKEIGYRSRAAFKLIQLNKKFGFLDKSRLCIDLCAAPGGWMQVAHQTMLPSNTVIAIDQDPIKSLENCVTIHEDINSSNCLKLIDKSLKSWKADVVLCDGAPHYGADFKIEQLTQNKLVLRALQIATNYLRKDGWFVVKVARTRFFDPLINAFSQLFSRVSVTKPEASRHDSTEVYVICKGFSVKCSKNLDFDFFNAETFFAENEEKSKPILSSIKEIFKSNAAQKLSVKLSHIPKKCGIVQFVKCDNYLDIIAASYEIVLDDEIIKSDALTSDRIKNYFSDLKLINRNGVKEILKYRKEIFDKYFAPEIRSVETLQEYSTSDRDDKKDERDVIKERIREEKKAAKKLEKQMIRKSERSLKTSVPVLADDFDSNDEDEMLNESGGEEDETLFTSQIKKQMNLQKFDTIDAGVSASDNAYDNYATDCNIFNAKTIASEKVREARQWLDDISKNVNIDEESSGMDEDSNEINEEPSEKKERKKCEVSRVKMDAKEMALAASMAYSKKSKRDFLLQSINRHMNYHSNQEQNLPNWFLEDERRNSGPCQIEGLDQSKIDSYEKILNPKNTIGSKSLGKLAEVRARRRRKLEARLNKAHSAAESIMEDEFTPTSQKVKKMRDLYRNVLKRQEKKYIVGAKRHHGRLPRNVKGQYKLVDRRMKKDKRVRKSKRIVKKT